MNYADCSFYGVVCSVRSIIFQLAKTLFLLIVFQEIYKEKYHL